MSVLFKILACYSEFNILLGENQIKKERSRCDLLLSQNFHISTIVFLGPANTWPILYMPSSLISSGEITTKPIP